MSTGCVTMAAPPPVATLGGPATAPRGGSEVGFGSGTGMSLFRGAHSGGIGWMGGYRHGLTDELDLGVDALGVQHSDKGTMAFKVALRQALTPRLRLEVGVGAADDSDGKSLSYDLALVAGTRHADAPWNHYGAVRTVGAFGLRGDVCCGAGATGTQAPPSSFLILGTAGAAARLTESLRLVFEGGAGPLWVRGRREVGVAFYYGVGLLADLGARGGP
jgi:hypothetical protein